MESKKEQYAMSRGAWDANSLQNIAKRDVEGFVKVLAPNMLPSDEAQKAHLYEFYCMAYDEAKSSN